MANQHDPDRVLKVAQRLHVAGITTEPVVPLSVPQQRRFVFRATVYTSKDCRGFTAYAEADPSTVPPELHGCELRIAETRAIKRALRKAYRLTARSNAKKPTASPKAERESQPIRERFTQVATQLGIAPNLLKAYAQAFCETSSLRAAGPQRLASFLDRVEEQANRDREGLLALIAQHAPTGGTQ